MYKFKTNYAITTILLLLGIFTTAQARDNSLPIPEEVILRWNRVINATVNIPGVHPPTILVTRSFSMIHLAMFDAVNSIDGRYRPYLTDVPGTKHASIEAAASKAAYDVLSALYPSQQAIFDAEFAESLIGIEENRMRQGFRVGEIVAARILENRANDGWTAPLPPYTIPPTPGNWQPTPPAFAPAAFTHFANVKPFATTGSAQFRPNPPPSMTSAEYTNDFNEAKALGSATSVVRTADQTLVARLWQSPAVSLTIWNNVARNAAIAHRTGTVENARLFALLYMAHHDGLQTSFTSKYFYGFWRPIQAIRRADEDGNPNTISDAAWNSLLVNPPYPTYAGNAATQGAAEGTILALFFGRDDIPITAIWDGTPSATRSYSGFSALANEQARSRIYGGIHFQFDSTAGQAIGHNVANFVFGNYLKPR